MTYSKIIQISFHCRWLQPTENYKLLNPALAKTLPHFLAKANLLSAIAPLAEANGNISSL